jgi:hypothetical protein
MPQREFKPGFRFSLLDLAILLLGGFGAILAWAENGWAGFLVAFVVLHFFLFCNVFRISRSPELVWAAAFVLLAGGTIMGDFPGWMFTIIFSLCITGRVLLREMEMPWYHGIGWQRLNPGLPQWWESHRKD